MLLLGHYSRVLRHLSNSVSRVPLHGVCSIGVQEFKKRHVRQRSVTKYISSKDNATFEEIIEAADLFKKTDS